jgi:hypothetical protein
VTNFTTANRIHAFGKKADAQKHASLFKGTLLQDSQRPFAGAVPECVR